MPRAQALTLGSSLLLSTLLGCSTTGGVSLRADGSPGPEKCPRETLKLMRYLRLDIGEGADVELRVARRSSSGTTRHDLPVKKRCVVPSASGHSIRYARRPSCARDKRSSASAPRAP